MAERDQLLGEPGHHPFGSTVKLGRNRLRQGGDLRDMHRFHLSRGGFPSPPTNCGRSNTNERGREYFKFGRELIFRGRGNLFAFAPSTPIRGIKRRSAA